MADNRNCAQCGTKFLPLREHARFCSPRCRIAWNRQNALDPAADGTLPWAVSAMSASTDRLLAATAPDLGTAFMVVTEAVWWVTLVDATLVRYHEATYGHLLASRNDDERQIIEDTFGGLRFVRNQMACEPDPGDLICPPQQSGQPNDRVTEWTWNSAFKPILAAQQGSSRDWELTRHRAYQLQLAGNPIGGTFTRAAAFLQQAWTTVTAVRA